MTVRVYTFGVVKKSSFDFNGPGHHRSNAEQHGALQHFKAAPSGRRG